MSEPESSDEGDRRRLKSPVFSEPSRSPPPRSPPALVRSSYYNPPTNSALIRFLEYYKSGSFEEVLYESDICKNQWNEKV